MRGGDQAAQGLRGGVCAVGHPEAAFYRPFGGGSMVEGLEVHNTARFQQAAREPSVVVHSKKSRNSKFIPAIWVMMKAEFSKAFFLQRKPKDQKRSLEEMTPKAKKFYKHQKMTEFPNLGL